MLSIKNCSNCTTNAVGVWEQTWFDISYLEVQLKISVSVGALRRAVTGRDRR